MDQLKEKFRAVLAEGSDEDITDFVLKVLEGKIKPIYKEPYFYEQEADYLETLTDDALELDDKIESKMSQSVASILANMNNLKFVKQLLRTCYLFPKDAKCYEALKQFDEEILSIFWKAVANQQADFYYKDQWIFMLRQARKEDNLKNMEIAIDGILWLPDDEWEIKKSVVVEALEILSEIEDPDTIEYLLYNPENYFSMEKWRECVGENAASQILIRLLEGEENNK